MYIVILIPYKYNLTLVKFKEKLLIDRTAHVSTLKASSSSTLSFQASAMYNLSLATLFISLYAY